MKEIDTKNLFSNKKSARRWGLLEKFLARGWGLLKKKSCSTPGSGFYPLPEEGGVGTGKN